jgi:hypothetical protein
MQELSQRSFPVTVGTTDTPISGFCEQRQRLIISAPKTNFVTISLQGAAVSGQGTILRPATLPFILDKKDVG